MQSIEKGEGEWSESFRDGLTKHTRIHFQDWMSNLISFFKCFAMREEGLALYNDYWRTMWIGSITESELTALEDKYSN